MTARSAPASTAAPAAAHRWTVPFFALVGLSIGLVVFLLRPPTYEAQALVAVSQPVGPIAAEIDVVTSNAVLGAAEAVLGYPPQVTVTAAEVSNLLTITATRSDAEEAAETVNVVAETYVLAQLGAAANVAQRADVPDSTSGLGKLVYAVAGTLVGAIVGAAVRSVQLARGPRTSSDRSRRRAPHAGPPGEHDATALVAARPDSVVPRGGPPDHSTLAPESAQPAPVQASPGPSVGSELEPAVGPASVGAAAHTSTAQATPMPPTVSQVRHVEPQPSPEAQPAAPPLPPTPREPIAMDTPTSSFSDAAGDLLPGGGTGLASTDVPPTFGSAAPLDDLERRALQTQYESAHYELLLEHEEEVARLIAEHERNVGDLRAEIATLNKQVRLQATKLNNRTGNDQTRVGDLEAQVDALEVELAASRQALESERIAHAKQMTDERGVADRALDNARRQYREELARHVHSHRQTMVEHRADLDRELAEDRTKHQAALEEQHDEYERQLEAERRRAAAKLAAASERHERDLADVRAANRIALDRQAQQHKETIEALRETSESAEGFVRDLEKENRGLRVEITSLRKQAQHHQNDSAAEVQRLSDEVATMRSELEGERERNAALRADVLRRSAESHQAIDRAVEERTAQLAELEASVTRQREYADSRVREMSAAAEEQARQAASREATLTATVSRLQREIEQLKSSRRSD